jgi:hypothetical protein
MSRAEGFRLADEEKKVILEIGDASKTVGAFTHNNVRGRK